MFAEHMGWLATWEQSGATGSVGFIHAFATVRAVEKWKVSHYSVTDHVPRLFRQQEWPIELLLGGSTDPTNEERPRGSSRHG